MYIFFLSIDLEGFYSRHAMNKSDGLTIAIILGVLFVCITSAWPIENNPPYVYNRKHYVPDGDEADPEMMYAILTKLGQTIIKANDAENNGEFFSSKRGLDLGLSRGYSGSQQAKHMMGIAAAELSGGPGRKRRGDDELNMFRYRLPQFLLPPE